MKTIAIIFVLAVLGGAACNNKKTGNTNSGSPDYTTSDTPTAAYKRLYEAVKSKDTEAIKKELTKRTIALGEAVAKQRNDPPAKVFENGFTATTFAESIPEIRDERVHDNMAALEVYNSKEKKWEDLAFVLEDGQWKLAVGEMFAGTYKSPGKGRAQKEAEAANAAGVNRPNIINPGVDLPGMSGNAAPSKNAPPRH